MLWDTRERFRIDRVRGTQASGINEVHQLYIDALKLARPGADHAGHARRDAPGRHAAQPGRGAQREFCRLWESFAGRGMGFAARDTADTGFNSVVADFSVPDGCVAPPSLPVVTVTVDVPTASEAGLVPGQFRLTRSVVSNEAMTVQLRISGTALNGTDYIAVPLSATIPAGAADVVIPIVPIDDTLVEANETVLLRLRSGGPYVVGSPSSGTVTIVSDDVAPDLAVSSLTIPQRGAPGLVFQVTDTTNNQGTGTAPASTTSFYLSINSVLETSDPVVATRLVPELAAGTSSTGTTSVTLPDGLAPGSYTLFAKADGPGQSARPTSSTTPASDSFRLVPTSRSQRSPDLPPLEREARSLCLTRRQIPGWAPRRPPSPASIYRRTSTWTPATCCSRVAAVPALDGGISSTASTSLTIPASTQDGTYYLIAKADGTDTVAESNETNNTRTVLIRVGPDLVGLGRNGSGAGGRRIVNRRH